MALKSRDVANNLKKGDTLYFLPSINVGLQKKNVPPDS